MWRTEVAKEGNEVLQSEMTQLVQVKIVRNQKNGKVEPSSVFQKDIQDLLLSLSHRLAVSHIAQPCSVFFGVDSTFRCCLLGGTLKRVGFSLLISRLMAEAQSVKGSCLLGHSEQRDNVGLGRREMERLEDEEGDRRQKACLVQIITSWIKAICIN